MKVEIYTLVYNEEWLMPFFIKHYRKRFLDVEIIVYDNYSTDLTAQIALAEGCTVRYFQTDGIRVDLQMQWRENVWKNSKADWVMIVDMDEFINIWQDDLENAGIDNMFRCYGFDMVGKTMNIDKIEYGARMGNGFDRTCIFKPGDIESINWTMGSHTSAPRAKKGKCLVWSEKRPLLWHMKYFYLPYMVARYEELAPRLTEKDNKNGWSFHYKFSIEKIKQEFKIREAKKQRVRISCNSEQSVRKVSSQTFVYAEQMGLMDM